MSTSRRSESPRSAAAGNRSTIGEQLREARKKRKLKIDKVASGLNLDASIINALENDDSNTLPAPIFVQGYLRSYARLLGLPEDDIVRDYMRGSHEPPPLKAIRASGKTSYLSLPSAKLLRNVVLSLLVIALVWLAWPYVETYLGERDSAPEEPVPGQLQLPPEG